MNLVKIMNSCIKVILIVVLIFLNNSCVPSSKSLIDGTWAIEKLYYQGEDVFEEEVFTNMMSFRSDFSAGFPMIGSDILSKKDYEGTWLLNKKNKTLTFETKVKYLNDTFNLCFTTNEEKGYIKMVLSNESTYIEAGKVLSSTEFLIALPLSCKKSKI